MPFRDIAALVRFDHDLQENQQLRDEFESLEIKFIQTFIKFQILFKVWDCFDVSKTLRIPRFIL